MDEDLGDPIGVGRAAEVFLRPDGTVLRRYLLDRSCEVEGRAMTWLRQQGIPVPVVHRAEGRDLVMDFVAGPTMMARLEARPWTVAGAARQLASLQRRIA
ncbi:MAG: hypothetical protein R2695_22220, partial [Acidimicrobiales bacterium]